MQPLHDLPLLRNALIPPSLEGGVCWGYSTCNDVIDIKIKQTQDCVDEDSFDIYQTLKEFKKRNVTGEV